MVSEGLRGEAWVELRSWERKRPMGALRTWLLKIGAAAIETEECGWVEDEYWTSYRPVESRLEVVLGKQTDPFAATAVNSMVMD